MKTLLVSDIHANLTALEAVIAAAGSFDATWCLGDLVGYGPDPNECVERVAALPNLLCVLGNHDAATLRRIEIDAFNPEARTALLWTQQRLTEANAAFLRERPEMITVDQITLVHGSPRQPVWEYLLDTRTATANFEFFDTLYCFVGHTHLPVIYHLPDDPAHGASDRARKHHPGITGAPLYHQPRFGGTAPRSRPARRLCPARYGRLHL